MILQYCGIMNSYMNNIMCTCMYVCMYVHDSRLYGVPQLQNMLGLEQETDKWVLLVFRMNLLLSSGLEKVHFCLK